MGRSRSRRRKTMIFEPRNYWLLVACVLLVLVGFTAMRIENQVDGFISLYVSPILLFIGYIGVIYAILWQPNDENDES